ncbi:MAG: T9SS type A sorting domain-containing protein [Bacteroidetes bacterium]|nr:T9SS type A sorting domain-containing protein [Bacteroidota bacterium]
MRQVSFLFLFFFTTISLSASYISGKYTGNGAASKAVTGLGFKPEVVLVKGASTQDGWIATSTMTTGYAKLLTSTDAPTTGYINSFDTDGFTVGSSATSNTNGATYYFVAWDDADASITAGSFTPVNCGASAWSNGTYYNPGAMVTYGGNTYHNKSGHTASSGTNRPDINSTIWTNLGACSAFNVNISVGYRPEMLWVFGEGITNQWDEVSPPQFTLDNSNSNKMSHFTQGSVLASSEKIISDLSATGFTTRAVSDRGTHDGPANGVKYNYVAFKPGSTVQTGSYTGTGVNNKAVTTSVTPTFVMVKDFNGGQNTWFKASAMGTDTSYKFTGGPDVSAVKKLTATGFTVGVNGEVNTNTSTFEYFIMSGGSTLPVELVYFAGEKEGNAINLYWQTATELNSSHFVIERSFDGISFEAIGELAGAGNSATVLNYEFTDKNPHSGNNYYRLRQYDYDGADELFHTISLNFNNGLAMLNFKTLTNVIDDNANFSFTSESTGSYTVQLFDQLGKELNSKVITANKGNNNFDFSLSEYSSGYYIVRLTSLGSEMQQVKLLKR